MAQALGFRKFFLKNVLPKDDKRGDHDALVLALAVNCQTTKRMQLLWKLYGALASKFGLTKNDIHLSVGVAQVKAGGVLRTSTLPTLNLLLLLLILSSGGIL
jgi:hypothetical protein